MVISDNGAEMLKPEDIAQRMTSVERNGESIWNKDSEEELPAEEEQPTEEEQSTEDNSVLPKQEDDKQQGADGKDNSDDGSLTPPTTNELIEMARQGNDLAQYQLEAQGISWEDTNDKKADDNNQSALARIPKDNDGSPIYEQTDADTAWDAIVEQTDGDEDMAQSVADSMVFDKEKALHDVENEEIAQSGSVADKIAAAKQHKQNVENAKAELEHWKEIAGTLNRRGEKDTKEQPADENNAPITQEENNVPQAKENNVPTNEVNDNTASQTDETITPVEQADKSVVQQEEENNEAPTSEEEPQSIGKGAFGNIYDQFKGKVKEALAFIMKHKSGDLLGVFHRDNFGDVDLVWGSNEKSNGLDHIIEKHIKAHNDFTSVDDAIEKIDDIIKNGSINEKKSKWDKVVFEKDGYSVVVSKNVRDKNGNIVDNNKNWVVTAFDNTKSQGNKKRSSPSDATRVTPNTNQGGRAVTPNDETSTSEDTPNSTELQDNEEESSHKGFAPDEKVIEENVQRSERALGIPSSAKREKTEVKVSDNGKVMVIKTDYSANGSKASLITLLAENDGQLDWAAQSFVDGKPTSELKYDYTLSHDDMMEMFDDNGAIRQDINPLKQIARNAGIDIDALLNGKEHGTKVSIEESKDGAIAETEKDTNAIPKEHNDDKKPIKPTENRPKETKQKNSGQFGLVSDERMEELKRKLRTKLNGQLNVGIDPEILTIAAELATGYIDRGLKAFGDFAKAMIDDIGDVARPYIKMSYNAARDWFEENKIPLYEEMTPYEEVKRFDVANYGREHVDTIEQAKQIANEQKVEEQAKKIKGEKTSEDKGDTPLSTKIATASTEVNTEPTEAQKEAGNYKKGHVQVGTFDITIEQPEGSVRKGTDANGKQWESKMHNTYGYFRGTEGVDGDHIDVFLSNYIDDWNGRKVYVVDQYNPDGTFDEHKVMLGFNDMDEAKSDYLANYEKGWEDGRRIVVSATNLEDFEKWIDSSHRKTKPFAEYAGVKKETIGNAPAKEEATPTKAETKQTKTSESKGYTITPSTYTNKKGKTSNVSLLTFNGELTAEQERAVKEFAKEKLGDGRYAPTRGWKDRESGGWIFRSEEDARKAAELVSGNEAKTEQAETKQEKQSSPISEEEKQAVIKKYELEIDEDTYVDFGRNERVHEFVIYNSIPVRLVGYQNLVHLKDVCKSLGGKYEEDENSFIFEDKDAAKKMMDALVDLAVRYERSEELKTDGTNQTEERIAKSANTATDTNNNSQNNEEVHLRNGGSDAKGKGGHQRGQNEPLGEETGNTNEQPKSRGMGGRGKSHTQSDTNGGGGVSGVSGKSSNVKQNTHNNHGERGVDYAPKSVKARIQANIDALELAKRLLENGETASEEDMAVLRKFSGWGGLGSVFGYSYDMRQYQNKLKELLGEDGYKAALDSTQSAFYTPVDVIDSLWDIVTKLGVKGGNVLEGSAGIGNILGQMPIGISNHSRIQAVEVDPTSGGILSLLYPDAKTYIQGFEQTKIPNNSINLAITNVPFVSGLLVNDTSGDADLSKMFSNIHDFCIAKNVRKLRQGGIGVFITSSSTLDNSTRLRDWLVNDGDADVIGAFRLNNSTFGGTKATSDIIVVRKRVNGVKSANAIDVSNIVVARTAMFKDKGEKKEKPRALTYNEYFVKHPEMMGGEMRFGFEERNSYRPTSVGLYERDGINQKERLQAFVDSFKNMKEENGVPEEEESPEDMAARLNEKLGDDVKEGSLVMNKKGQLCVARGGVAQPILANAKKGESASEEELAKRFNDKKVKGYTKAEVFDDYQAIKTALKAVLDYQSEHDDDKDLKSLLDKLNKAYDHFVNTYGHFHKNNQLAWLRKNDVDYANVLSLETYKEKGDKEGNRIKEYGKSDIFKHRVVGVKKEQKPKTIKDAIMSSLYKTNHIDLGYIADTLGKSEEEVKQSIIADGLGFENPISGRMDVSYVYLSGNVRDKLEAAKANNEDGRYNANIKALEKVVPTEIPAHLIEFSIGSSWCPKGLYEEYIEERTGVKAKLTYAGGTWTMEATNEMSEKNRSFGVRSEKEEFKGVEKLGSDLILAAMTYKSVVFGKSEKDFYGKSHFIKDKDATLECARCIDEIRQDFKDWARNKMQTDEALAEHITKTYNEKFNSYVPLKITDEFAPTRLDGMSETLDGKTTFELRPHQARAVVKCVTENTLLAHQVGTGKTFTLITTAMQMRKLGTAKKPMIVVQNATTGQFVESAKQLYPNAKILTISEEDKGEDGRKNFYAKIRYNDWDMIVVPQSVFERIPDSKERKIKYIQEKIEEKIHIFYALEESRERSRILKEIENLKNDLAEDSEKDVADGMPMMVDSIENAQGQLSAKELKDRAKATNNAKVKAERMLERKTDEVVDFDQMGIDALLVDEAHAYKHLGFATAMTRGVKGVDPSFSKRSQGLYLKIQSVKEKNGGKNIVFATGTPVSNTAAEIWTMLRYLCPQEMLKSNDIFYFDDFVRNFGRIEQKAEFTPSGAFKENNRFLGYTNMAELARLILSCTDFVLTSDAKGVNDKIPELEGGKVQDIYLPQTKALYSVMKYVRSELQRFEEMSGKEKKENSDLVLRMYGIATAAAVDPRLVVDNAEDDTNSKTNEAVRQTLKDLKETADYNGTIAIFADHYQNKQSGFNLYEEIKKKLIEDGVPSDQIVIMKSGMTDKAKLDTFDKVNRGEVRVILGSTATLGTGVNIQERLHTLIHLDAPNRPMDYEQRNGRILRQGNMHREWNKPVRVIRMGVEDSLDVSAYQRLKTKQLFVNAIMNSEEYLKNALDNRTLDEEDDDFGDVVANLSGSQYAILKQQVERDLKRYESREKQWEADQRYIGMNKPRLQGEIKREEELIKDNKERVTKLEKMFPNGTFKEIRIGKLSFGSVDEMEEYIKDHNKRVHEASDKAREDGKTTTKWTTTIDIDGLKFEVETEISPKMESQGVSLITKASRKMSYSCKELGLENIPVSKQLMKNCIEDIVDNVITANDYKERIGVYENSVEKYKRDLQLMEQREGKPFEFSKQLEDARVKYMEYEALMKQELAEKAKKYAELDKQTDAATDVHYTGTDNEEEDEKKSEVSDDELMREGDMRNPNEMSESEKAEIGNALVNAPTIDVASNQIVKTEDMSARKAAEKWWRDNIGEPLFYDTEVGVVEINENSIGTSLAHRYGQAKLDAITSLKDGFKNAVYLGTIKDFIRTEKSVLNHYFAYPINYNGKRCYVFCRAMQDNNKNRLYVHEVFVADNIQEEGNTLQTAAQKPHGGIALYKAILSDALNAANVGNNSELYNFSNEKDEVRQSQERITLPTSVQEQVEAMHLSGEVEVVADGSGFKGKKRKAKGFYNKQTGKITIILGNHTSVEDVMQTLMHEAVAHKGLRKLFGKDFDTFLDKVFAGAEKPIREKIVAFAAKNGWNIRTATEEYLASLAEDKETFEKHGGFWEKVRNFFHEMAHKLFPKLVKIGDNEMRYELWRSYENLKNDSSVIAEAKDIAMQSNLKVGNYAEKQGNTFDEDAMLYREERERVDAKHDYEMAMKSASHKFVTAWADSMYSLKQLQDIICKNGNTQIADWENAYMAENRMSSINLAEMETYKKTFYKDMLDAIQSLMKGGVKYQDVVTYMYAKHGLERNKYIQDEEIGKLQQAFLDKYGEKPISRPNDFTSGIDRNDYASDDAYNKACQAAVDAAQKKYDEAEKKLNKKIAKIASSDYSGLSSLFNTNSGFKTAAQQYVSDFEKGREKKVDKSVEAHTDIKLSLIVDNFISRSLLIFLSLDVPTTTPLAKFSLLILIAVRTKN